MNRLLGFIERNMFDLLVVSIIMLVFYAFARLLGARFLVAAAFACLPIILARMYTAGSARELFVAMLS